MENTVTHPDLLADIIEHCADNSLSKAEFGKSVMGDPRFVYDLEAGRECRRATIEKVRAALAQKAA